MKIYTIYDSKTEMYSQPMFLPSRGAAVRAFADEAANKNSPISAHPEDYTLFELGEWDDMSASLTPHPTPHSVGLATDFKRSE